MKYILKSTTGSFFRTLGRILAYLFIAILIVLLCSHFDIMIAKASTIDYSKLEFTTSAQFYDCYGSYDCNHAVGTYNDISSSGSKVINQWISSSSITTYAYQYGMGLSFYVKEGFIKDNWYSVSVLLDGTKYPTYNVISAYTGVGTSLSGAVSVNNTTYTMHDDLNVSVNFYGDSTLSYSYSLVTYTFKASSTANYLFLTLGSTNDGTSTWKFLGYSYTSHGSDSSVDYNQINNSVNNAVNSLYSDLTNDINNVNNSINNVNNNINNLSSSILDIGSTMDTTINESTNNIVDKLDEQKNAILDVGQSVLDSTTNLEDTINSGNQATQDAINSSSQNIQDTINSGNQQTQQAIDNMNQATQDSINNSSQDIQNNLDTNFNELNKQFSDCITKTSPNLFNNKLKPDKILNASVTITDTGLTITNTGSSYGYVFYNINDLPRSMSLSFKSDYNLNSGHSAWQDNAVSFVYTNKSTGNNYGFYWNSPYGPTDLDNYDYYLGFYVQPNVTYTVSDIMLVEGTFTKTYEPYGTQEICENKLDSMNDKQNQTNQKLDDLNSNITDSNVDSENANDFFSNFSDGQQYSVSDVITMPLSIIKNITNQTCTPLSIPLPFVNKNIELPCMNEIYTTYFSGFYTLYQTITFGVIAYWICIDITRMIKNFKNPEKDNVEVFEL